MNKSWRGCAGRPVLWTGYPVDCLDLAWLVKTGRSAVNVSLPRYWSVAPERRFLRVWFWGDCTDGLVAQLVRAHA
jgi:hypothetical protein